MDAWVEAEVVQSEFPDERLKHRFGKLLSSLGKKIGDTIPTACVDWAATKAACRFFSNPRVDEGCILSGHFAALRVAFRRLPDRSLYSTTQNEFSFQRDRPEKIIQSHVTHTHKGGPVTVCGFLCIQVW